MQQTSNSGLGVGRMTDDWLTAQATEYVKQKHFGIRLGLGGLLA